MWWDPSKQDPDKFFAYKTSKLVYIRDRTLGITEQLIQVCLAAYIFFGIIVYGKGYLEVEYGKGSVVTHIRGDVYAVSKGGHAGRYFSAEDLSYPGMENGNVFVSSRHKIYKQKRGICEDFTKLCVGDYDCTPNISAKCTENGLCLEKSWCNVDSEPESYELDIANVNIWVKTSVQFLKLAPQKIYSTEDNHPYPENGYNAFTVRDLLMLAQPVAVRYEEVAELGCAIEVQFQWNCETARDICRPNVTARRLDTRFDPENIGFAFTYTDHISEHERQLHEVQGIRIYLRSVGVGTAYSNMALILKLSTSCMLLSLAPICADLFMLRLHRLKRKFHARKFEIPDLKDFDERNGVKKATDPTSPNRTGDDEDDQEDEHDTQQREFLKLVNEED